MITILYYLRTFVLWLNYKLGRYRTTLWLIGDARSGTTWISSLLNPKLELRELFEPFHPNLVERASFLKLYEYVRPDSLKPSLGALCTDVFSGNFYHLRVDRASKRLAYNGLLVKDIFANLFAYSVYASFPHVRIILLIRNPFAVALSKKGKDSWDWETDPGIFLKDKKLMKDHLGTYEELIRSTIEKGDFILNQVLIWAIINYVPLRQFTEDKLAILFYEAVLQNPVAEISRVKQQLGLLEPGQKQEIPETIIKTPSAVTEKQKGAFGANLNAWQDHITGQQLEDGEAILKAFKMREFFGEKWQPDLDAVKKFMRQNVA